MPPFEVPHGPHLMNPGGEPMSKWSKAFWADLGERVLSTFLQALLGTAVLTGTTPVDWSDGKAIWATLGVPTALSLVKGLLANMANPESGPSLLPSPPAPEVPADGEAA